MECFKNEDTVVDVPIESGESMTVCGDIHGDYEALCKIFNLSGYPSATHKYVRPTRNLSIFTKCFSCLMGMSLIEDTNLLNVCLPCWPSKLHFREACSLLVAIMNPNS